MLPADYVTAHVELAYASTAHGVQGETVTGAHVVIGENTGAASAYVGMTRGREFNTAHLLATDADEARQQWIAVFARDRADLGPTHAAQLAAAEAARYAAPRPLEQALADLHSAWAAEQRCLEQLAYWKPERDTLREVVALEAPHAGELANLEAARDEAASAAERAKQWAGDCGAAVAAHADRIREELLARWDRERDAARQAAHVVLDGPGRLRLRRAAVNWAGEQLVTGPTAGGSTCRPCPPTRRTSPRLPAGSTTAPRCGKRSTPPPTAARRTEMMIRLHIEGTRLGGRTLADVRPSEVQAWATDRSRVLAPTTLRQAVGLLRSVYGAAVLDRLVASSPVVRIQLPRHERERVVPLSVEQVAALAGAMPHRYRAMVLTQAGLGLRIGELLALRVQDVDFPRRAVRIEWQFTQGSKGERDEPKTPRSKRMIPLPRVVAEALAAHLAASPAAEDETIFTTGKGAPLGHVDYGHNLMTRAVTKAGLPKATTSHDLRHHYASVLLAAGESVVAVAERLGHEDASLVLSTYGYLMPDSDDRTRSAIDAAWDTASALCAPDVPQGAQTVR